MCLLSTLLSSLLSLLSQPVETGSDWEIPSRFSFQPMAPRKNLDLGYAHSLCGLALDCASVNRRCYYWLEHASVTFNSLKRPRDHSARREKRGQTPVAEWTPRCVRSKVATAQPPNNSFIWEFRGTNSHTTILRVIITADSIYVRRTVSL